VPREKVSRYGVIDGREIEDRIYLVKDLVEKPAPENAPSNLVIASRYVLTPDIFDLIDHVKPGRNGEIQLTDALRQQAAARPFYGCRVESIRHDAGNNLDFIKTNILYALERPDLHAPLGDFILEQADRIRRDRHAKTGDENVMPKHKSR